MKHYKTTACCSACGTKFLYAITEEEIEETDILEATCPECGAMAELKNLIPCNELTYEDITETYEDWLEKDLEFDIDDFEDQDDSKDNDW